MCGELIEVRQWYTLSIIRIQDTVKDVTSGHENPFAIQEVVEILNSLKKKTIYKLLQFGIL
jgi:hypothetical protein